MKTRFLSIIAISALAVACGENASHNNHSSADSSSHEQNAPAEEVGAMADFKFHSMIANLPSPLQTFQIIDNVDLSEKNIELTPIAQAGKLSTNSSKAYGYGVYVTDMGFMAYQKQNQMTLEYLQACRTLATDLGAGDVFDQTITKNFEENSSEEAKFVRMMDEAFNEMDQYMVNNERFINATEIFVGSWVESQIIATKMLLGVELSDENRPVYEGIYSQKMHASNLMNVLGEVDDQISKEIYASVEDLMMFYAGFSDIESITQEDLNELHMKLGKLKAQLLA
jgi:hypothetical protein